jgi:hypothetical protein
MSFIEKPIPKPIPITEPPVPLIIDNSIKTYCYEVNICYDHVETLMWSCQNNDCNKKYTEETDNCDNCGSKVLPSCWYQKILDDKKYIKTDCDLSDLDEVDNTDVELQLTDKRISEPEAFEQIESIVTSETDAIIFASVMQQRKIKIKGLNLG